MRTSCALALSQMQLCAHIQCPTLAGHEWKESFCQLGSGSVLCWAWLLSGSGYGCSKLAPACHTFVATCQAHQTGKTMGWMAEWCEDINSERVIGRREGNVWRVWRWTPLQGTRARRPHVGQEKKTVRSLQTQRGVIGSPQSQISWDLLPEMSSK